MKQVLIKKGQILVEEVPAPALDDKGVLVEVAYSLISAGTETSSVTSSGKSLIQRAFEQPQQVLRALDMVRRDGLIPTLTTIRGITEGAMPTGYSCSGTVLAVGGQVTDMQLGARVACAGAGRANHAELVVVPRNLVVEVPQGCDLADAASVTLGAIALQGVRRADPRLGEIVAVIGLGLLGQITVQLLKAAGCKVIGLELDERRLALAKTLGMDAGFNSGDGDVVRQVRHLSGGHGVDSVIITAASSSDAIAQQAMEVCRRKGKVVVVGAVGLGLKRSPFYEKEIDFLISTSYGPGRYDNHYELEGADYPYAYVRWTENRNMQAYVQLVAEGKINVKALIERRYKIEEASEAFAELRTSKPLGVLLEYPERSKAEANKRETKLTLRPVLKTERVGVAVIGAGSFAQGMHLPNLQKLADLYQLRAVVNATGPKAKAVAEQFKAEYASTSYEEVLADPNVDMVLICTRHHLHAQQAIAAARAGKAILLEKPMALNKVELDELVAVLKETQVPFMVGYNRRFSPYAVEARRHTAERINPLFMRYRMNAGYIPLDHWVHGPEGGGRLIGEACHIIDLFTSFTEERIKSVSVTHLQPKTASVSATDNASIALTYEDGSVGVLDYFATGSRDLPKEQFEIHFDEKSIMIDDYRVMQGYGVKMTPLKSSSSEKGHVQELEAFHQMVKSGVWPIALWDLVDVGTRTLQLAQSLVTLD
jgi:predicted dehydrogenase/threonine dehydrogenase-like Zn-dependent dehydrogenase